MIFESIFHTIIALIISHNYLTRLKRIWFFLQDFTGVPAVVDLAAMRDAIKRLGGDANKINPLVSYYFNNAYFLYGSCIFFSNVTCFAFLMGFHNGCLTFYGLKHRCQLILL